MRLEAFQGQLDASGLIPSGAQVLVGYSGGADSTCLLHLLALCKVKVVAAHLHHGQREEADEEQIRCQNFAEGLGVPFATGRADVPAIARDFKIGLEEAGRKARYEFFREAAFRTGCTLIATAHTLDDHIETILMNLVRGAGLEGLRGIPVQRGSIIRPILVFSRQETRQYCQELGLWFHDDPANADLSFSRARIRHRVLPELRTINPAADQAVARLAKLVEQEERFLNGMAAAALEQSEKPLNGRLVFLTKDCEVAFEKDRLLSLPEPLLRRGLRLAVGALGGALDYNQTEALSLGIQTQQKGSITADEGELVVEWDSEKVHLRLIHPSELYSFPLTVPGQTISEVFGWQIVTHVSQSPQDFPREKAALTVMVAKEALDGRLVLRSAEPGDQIQPLGMQGHKKLSDLFQRAGLTLAARKRLPIICDRLSPIWVPGICLAERVKIKPETKEAFLLRLEPLPELSALGGQETV